MRYQLYRYLCLTGIEGARKTESAIKATLEIATKESPVLFAYRDYSLLRENREKLIKRFGIRKKEICVCGTNMNYEEALISYTNPEKPKYMTWHAKYILCTQAVLQRKRHLDFYSSKHQNKKFSAIVVDEFDFGLCAIPTLKYQRSRIASETIKEDTEYDILEWVRRNYSKDDYERLSIAESTEDKYANFVLADWLTSSEAPIVFLTSETLAARFLRTIGFKEIYLKSPNYKNCVVNVHANKNVVGEFFKVMGDGNYWDELSNQYDMIVSDKVVKQNADDENDDTDWLRNERTFDVLNHTVVRGTNNWIGKKILTVLSHVPSEALSDIREMFNAFGDNITDEKVYQMYYRDRLCQAVGRVLGNRGGVETDLLAHESIVKIVVQDETFPYSFKDFQLKHSKLDEIWQKTEELREQNKNRRKRYEEEKIKRKVEKTLFELDELLVKKEDSYISSKELGKFLKEHNVKSKYGKQNIPVTKVAEHFGVPIKRLTINKVKTLYVVGLGFKQEV